MILKGAMSMSTNFKQIPSKVKNDLFFEALACAVVRVADDLSIHPHNETENLFSHPVVESSLDVLSSSTVSKFKKWFTMKNKIDIEQYRNWVTSVQNIDDLINGLGEKVFSSEEAKMKGAIFTPSWLAKEIIKKALRSWKQYNNGKGEPAIVGDLSCGPGIFIHHLMNLLEKPSNIYGVDNCPEFVALARLFNGVTSQKHLVQIDCLDTLLDGEKGHSYNDVIPKKGYNIIVGNPPYIRSQLLDPIYNARLKQFFPEFTKGNYDLTVLFLLHTIKALATGGVASLVVSSKFMDSKYGLEICMKLANDVRVLDIVDFGDGQVFQGKTTYTAVITFIKLPPSATISIFQFPSGLRWDKNGKYLKEARKFEIPIERLKTHPWDFSTGMHQKIIGLLKKTELPLLTNIFPRIIQGIRTGANNVFILKDQKEFKEIESKILVPFISGKNIRKCKVIPPTSSLLWPYRVNNDQKIQPINEFELKSKYPGAWVYLEKHKDVLTERNFDGSNWYAYSRSQNLGLANYPKILIREMMPYACFAADEKGDYVFSSGYALIAPPNMSVQEIRMWTAILSTPTMEFQFRFVCTQLHSGWFRVLKEHLKNIRLVEFDINNHIKAIEISEKLHRNNSDQELWDELDEIVAHAFNLKDDQRREIKNYLSEIHSVSCASKKTKNESSNNRSISIRRDKGATAYPDLTEVQKRRYYPVEIAQYNKYHRNRDDLGNLVTFTKNKKEKTPIHSWYQYTQGFSEDLVKILLDEFGATVKSSVYDPFQGCGTTLLTCRKLGIDSYGSDVSPLMTWITKMKVDNWNTTELHQLTSLLENTVIRSSEEYSNILFFKYMRKAFDEGVLEQIINYRNWIQTLDVKTRYKDFLMLGLISILEEISKIRKHGSHYRFLDNTNSVGLKKLNIKLIESGTDIKPLLINKLRSMVYDIEQNRFKTPLAKCESFTLDSRKEYPKGKMVDYVITSPPYLNRNNYFSQQKAELSVLGLLSSISEYKKLVKSSLRSHVEGDFSKDAISIIPEVNEIINSIELTENNNPKIPHMIAGYFDDLYYTFENLERIIKKGGRLAFVVGNVRWGGVVVPVDHLLALIAERLGFKLEKIFVTRFKGNSPQQMKRYGKIPVRESIVILRY